VLLVYIVTRLDSGPTLLLVIGFQQCTPRGFFNKAGGLLSYGPDNADQYRRAAGYVDRILKGEKPADMPVQVPTKYRLVISLKTVKAPGITVPR
jgi:ABC-type uncharacterized transport system substrate-binding protein